MRGPRGGAEGGVAVAALEDRAPVGEGLQVGREHVPVAVGAGGQGRELVGHHQQDVRRGLVVGGVIRVARRLTSLQRGSNIAASRRRGAKEDGERGTAGREQQAGCVAAGGGGGGFAAGGARRVRGRRVTPGGRRRSGRRRPGSASTRAPPSRRPSPSAWRRSSRQQPQIELEYTPAPGRLPAGDPHPRRGGTLADVLYLQNLVFEGLAVAGRPAADRRPDQAGQGGPQAVVGGRGQGLRLRGQAAGAPGAGADPALLALLQPRRLPARRAARAGRDLDAGRPGRRPRTG